MEVISPHSAIARRMPSTTCENSASVSQYSPPSFSAAPLGKRYTSRVTGSPFSRCPTICLPLEAPMSMARNCFIPPLPFYSASIIEHFPPRRNDRIYAKKGRELTFPSFRYPFQALGTFPRHSASVSVPPSQVKEIVVCTPFIQVSPGRDAGFSTSLHCSFVPA